MVMRVFLNSLVLACALAASGCFLAENAGPGHPCSDDSECPASYRCVTVSADQRSCEVVYPPVPLETDAWGLDVVVSGSQKALMNDAGCR